MKVGIMQPHFFPYLGYWQLINAVDKYVVYDDVNYIKGGWINRNNLLMNGSKHLITLPLDNSSSFKLINEVEIIKNQLALNKVIKSIQLSYSKAPYFNMIMPFLETLLCENTNYMEKNWSNYAYYQCHPFLNAHL